MSDIVMTKNWSILAYSGKEALARAILICGMLQSLLDKQPTESVSDEALDHSRDLALFLGDEFHLDDVVTGGAGDREVLRVVVVHAVFASSIAA
jgi:hypothetical protein